MLGSLTAGMEMADMAWEIKCREEDLKQRALENERRAIDDARRSVDEKAQQLKALSHQSALIAGFTMVVMVEASIPDDLNPILSVVYASSCAVVVALMMISMLNATLMLVAILRYDCVSREVNFIDFWRLRCEDDFKTSLKAYSLGVPIFLAVLGLLGWVVFWDHHSRNYTSSIVSVIAALTIYRWVSHTERKWSDFLLSPDAKLFDPTAGTVGLMNYKDPGHSPFRNFEPRSQRQLVMHDNNSENDETKSDDGTTMELVPTISGSREEGEENHNPKEPIINDHPGLHKSASTWMSQRFRGLRTSTEKTTKVVSNTVCASTATTADDDDDDNRAGKR